MISAKFRLKEERRKVLKLSAWKLRGVEDAESCLRRSVLIHNTLRRLQRPPPSARLHASAALSSPSTPQEELRGGDAHERDVQAVLSQLRGPPTPSLLTSIDEEAMDGTTAQREAEETERPRFKRRRGSDDEEEEELETEEGALDEEEQSAKRLRPSAEESEDIEDFEDDSQTPLLQVDTGAQLEAELEHELDAEARAELELERALAEAMAGDMDEMEAIERVEDQAPSWQSPAGPSSPPLSCARSASLLADSLQGSAAFVASVES